jgi:hypothetical protein
MTRLVITVVSGYLIIAVGVALVNLALLLDDGQTPEVAFQNAILLGLGWPINLLLKFIT